MEKEEEKQFLKAITTVSREEPDQSDPKKTPSIWEVSFMPWQEIEEKAGDIDVVKAASDKPDKIVQRAIGIVFHKMPIKDWENEGTLNLIRAVVEQIEGTKQ